MLIMSIYQLNNFCISLAVIYNKKILEREACVKAIRVDEIAIRKLLVHSKESALTDLLSAFQEAIM